MIDFDGEYSSSIKSLAVKKDTKINLTRFLNEKMLMLSKIPIQSFAYDLIDIFMFPTNDVREVYRKNKMQRFDWHLLFFFFFVFICDVLCNQNEKISRDIIFQVLEVSKVLSRFDIFWVPYGVQRKELKKRVGLYEVDNINNRNFLSINVNPKYYFEKYKDFSVNEKHMGVKRNIPGIDFEAYSARISTLHEFCQHNKSEKIEQKRFQIINDLVQMKSVKKTQFAELNGKRFYFHDGIVSLPFGHALLKIIWKKKRKI